MNVAPKQPRAVMEAISQLKLISDPPPSFVIGLSNVSQNCKERRLLTWVYLSMASATA